MGHSERRSGHRHVIERVDDAADILTLLVSLARDDEDVADFEQASSGGDCLPPASNFP
jgi:hypothetical protein